MNNFENIQKQIEDKNAEIEKLMDSFREQIQKQFMEVTKFFFEETPIQAVSWAQYTPYFNDGEECVFRINDIYFVLDGFDPEDRPYSGYDYEDDDKYTVFSNRVDPRTYSHCRLAIEDENHQYHEYYKEQLNEWIEQNEKYPNLGNICTAFEKMINSNSGVMKDIFGDHVNVTLTKDETYVDEYEHE